MLTFALDMKRIITLLIALLSLTSVMAQAPKVYNEEIDPMLQIDDAVKEARETGRLVICQIGGNWCPWCLRFAKFITDDEEIRQFVEQNYVYIHVNYPRQGAAKPLLERLGNPGRFGYPVFVVLREDGSILHIQDSSYLEEGKGYDKDKVMRFFKNWTKDVVR